MRLFIVSILIFLAAGSCGGTKQSSVVQLSATQVSSTQDALFGKRWEATELNGEPVKLQNNSAFMILQNDADRNMSGNTSCNGFGGNYALDGNKLTFEPPMRTMRGCAGNSVEGPFLDVLARTTNFRIENNNLILLEGEKQIAVFTATE